MNYFSGFITVLLQQSAVGAPETEETAKHYCEEWFVYQGEEIENIFQTYSNILPLVASPTYTNAIV